MRTHVVSRGGLARQGQNSSSVRSANLAMVLREVVDSVDSPSRAEVANRLSMTRSTVSRLVDELIEGGLITEGKAIAGPRGRPGVPLTAAPDTVVALGIEVNVDKICLAVVDLAGNVIDICTKLVDCTVLAATEVLDDTGRLARGVCDRLEEGATLVGIHLAIPGLVDREGRTILRSPNLRWDGVVPAEHLADLLATLDVPFRVGNDIDASGLTVIEEFRDAGDDWASFIYITGEVGVGAAVILDRQLMTGRHGWASELGHVCVDPDGDVCGCGARGCLETIAGLPAVLRATGCMDLAEVLQRLADADARALAALRTVGRAVGQALSAAMNLLDVGNVVLGGYLAECAPWLTDELLSEVRTRVLWGSYSPIEVATVDDAPSRTARGAAMASLAHIVADPAAWLDSRHAAEAPA